MTGPSTVVARLWGRSPLMAGGVVLVAAGMVFTRALGTRTNYDEGVYLASLAALRDGQELGSEVYASQPPGFYDLLRLLGWPGGTSIEGIRVAFALLAVGGLVAAAVAAWRMAGAWAGVAAAAFVSIGPPYPTVSRTISADVPSVALALAALAFVCLAVTTPSERRSRTFAITGGGVLGLAIMTKLLALPFAVPIAAVVLARRRGRTLLPTVALSAVAVAGVVLALHASALGELWESVIGDHSDAEKAGTALGNLRMVAELLEPRTPFGWLVPAGFVCLLFVRPARAAWPLWTLVPASWVFLVLIRPLADHHMVLLSAGYGLAAGASLALAAARLPGRRRLTAAATIGVFVLAGLYQEQRRLERNDVSAPAELRWASEALVAVTPASAIVATDQPIVAFEARRSQPGQLVDVSSTRVTGGTLTAAEILEEIDDAAPVAVVAARMFRSLPAVMDGLAERYPVTEVCGDATLFLEQSFEAPLPPCPVPPA